MEMSSRWWIFGSILNIPFMRTKLLLSKKWQILIQPSDYKGKEGSTCHWNYGEIYARVGGLDLNVTEWGIEFLKD